MEATGRALPCTTDVEVEERAGGQMGENAEACNAASLRSGRGLYLSTLTLSLLRGTSAIITAAQRPIGAQLCGSHSHMHQAGG